MSFTEGYNRGFEDGYRQAELQMMNAGLMQQPGPTIPPVGMMQGFTESLPPTAVKSKRKVSAYHKRLGKAIKTLRKRHLLKTGKWRKGWNQKKMMKAAHKLAKR